MNVALPSPNLLTIRTDTVRGRSAMRARGIISDVTASIRTGALQPGDRLPDERSLCQRYAAGRHTVRKAMEALEGSGLIGRFVGRGSFVLPTVRPQVETEAQPATRTWTLFELTEARLLLEPGVAMLAAERRTQVDLARLHRCLQQIERAQTWRNFKEAKYAFHRSIAQLGGNEFIGHIFDQIIASRRGAWDGYRPRPQDLAAARDSCLEDSHTIFDAIAEGNPDRAANAVRGSITRLLMSMNDS